MAVPKIRFPEFTDDWEQRKLGFCFAERSERSGEGELIAVTINSGVVRAVDLDRKDNSSSDKSNYKVVCEGDIAYNSMRMWQGASGYSQYNGILSPAYTVLIPQADIDSKFFSYMFKRSDLIQTFQIHSQGLTSDTWNLKYPELSKIDIMVPKLDEQHRIAEFFDDLDFTLTLHQRKLDDLRLLKKSMLQKMFPKEGKDVPETRFPGFTDAWEQRKLGDIASSFAYGLNAAAKEFDGKHKYLRITDIDDVSRVFQDDNLTSPDADIDAADDYRLEEGDLLFARTGASVGKSYIYKESDGLVYYAGFLIRAKIRPEYDAEFVFQNTLTSTYEKYIKTTSQRSGQPGVNAKEYAEYSMSLPEYAEQVKIGMFLRKIDDAITLHQRKLEDLQKLKKALLQQMFC